MEEPTHNTMAQDFKALLAIARRPRKAFADHLVKMEPPVLAGEETYEEFFAQVDRSMLIKIAMGIVWPNRDMAEDVVQQALLKAYKNVSQGQPYAAPRKQFQYLKNNDPEYASLDLNQSVMPIRNVEAWMARIVHNTACNFVRTRQMALVSLEKVMREAERVESCYGLPEQEVIRQQEEEELRQYVAALPEPLSAMMRLQAFEGRSLQEVAEMLGYDYGTVRVYVSRARKMLKVMAAGEGEIVNGRLRKKHRRSRSSRQE